MLIAWYLRIRRPNKKYLEQENRGGFNQNSIHLIIVTCCMATNKLPLSMIGSNVSVCKISRDILIQTSSVHKYSTLT